VKALAVASAQGQKIYQITAANVGVVDSLNIGQEVKDEIAASVAVGKEVTVSEANITVAGWTGVGYIVSDPETGAGAYRISGGGNGGKLEVDANLDPIFAAIYAAFFAISVALSVLPFILMAATLGLIVASIIASISMALAWLAVKLNMSTDNPWRTFLVDMFGGILSAIIVGVLTGITVQVMLVTIFVLLVYSIFDAFVLARMWFRLPNYAYV
jgi:hypothetical protein